MNIRDAASNERGANVDAANNLQVIAAANSGVDIGDVDVLSLPTSPDTIADDAVFTVATSAVFPMGGFADETAPDSVGEGDIGAIRMSLNRNMYTQIRDGTAERSAAVDASNNLQVILASNTGVDIGDVDILSGPVGASALEVQGTAADGAAPVGDPVLIAGWDGTNVQQLKTDVNGELQVDVLSGGSEVTPTNPTNNFANSTATAAGASADLDTAEITEAEKLWGVAVSASVAFKVQIKKVENAASTNLSSLVFGRANEVLWLAPPHRDFWSHVGASAGLDVFRASVTNMDNSQAADLHATFHYASN